jgi:hypothetical protein
MTTKTCSRCRKPKPLSEFWRCARDGHQSMCKACKHEWRNSPKGKDSAARANHNWYLTEAGKRSIAASVKRRKPENGRASAKRQRQAHPDRGIARLYVRRLRKRGALPEVCSKQNQACSGRIEAHHHRGYAREHRKDVVMLCVRGVRRSKAAE